MFMFRVCCKKVYPKKDDMIALRLNEKCQLLIYTDRLLRYYNFFQRNQ